MNKLRTLIFTLLCMYGYHAIASQAAKACDLPQDPNAALRAITERYNTYKNKITVVVTYIPNILEHECSPNTKDYIEQLGKFETIRQHPKALLSNFNFSVHLIVTPNVFNSEKIDIVSRDHSSTWVQTTFDKIILNDSNQ